jgi:hypothetical protein
VAGSVDTVTMRSHTVGRVTAEIANTSLDKRRPPRLSSLDLHIYRVFLAGGGNLEVLSLWARESKMLESLVGPGRPQPSLTTRLARANTSLDERIFPLVPPLDLHIYMSPSGAQGHVRLLVSLTSPTLYTLCFNCL